MSKFAYLFIGCVLLLSCSAGKNTGSAKQYSVSGQVVKTGAHCGGARLPDDMLAELTKPQPFPNQKMFVKKGKTNSFSEAPIMEFTTDSLGRFTIKLVPGTYCIINEFKKDKKNYDNILSKYATETEYYGAVDKGCLDGWFSMPDFEVVVTNDAVRNITIVYAGKCPWNEIPCVMYKGPLPP